LKIKYLIKNQDQWPVLTQSARKFIEQKYNLNTLTDELIDRYRQIIK
jgi:glycosyltransferase involved in cell wall biosynthesis